MLKKRLAGLALVLSLALMVPHVSMAIGEKRNSIVKDIGAGVLSLGALAGAAYGLYWANDYNVKKTVKPFIKLAAIGSALTASYLCVGKFVLRNSKKQFKKEINDLGDTVINKLKEVKTTAENGLVQKLNEVQATFNFYLKRINPKNALKSTDQLQQEIDWEKRQKQIKESRDRFSESPDFLHEIYANGASNSHLNESVVVISEDGKDT